MAFITAAAENASTLTLAATRRGLERREGLEQVGTYIPTVPILRLYPPQAPAAHVLCQIWVAMRRKAR